MADVLTEILRAASKHPNSRVSKLIHTVEEEPTQKNIVLLLIELAEHSEYSTDFDISLKYYLNLFEHLGINHDLVLNEAGLLLVHSSKVYSKRVDYVQSLVERQILTLSNADHELQKQKLDGQKTENAAAVEKPKRGRKRALEAPSDPYEVELAPKKFKKLTEEKRFTASKVVLKAKTISRNIEMEQHIHPAGWQHATIYDFENEEDVDTKRNYKLFTYHVEHRYNTLVPDINFRLHFKVKDYMDEQEELEEDEACNTDRSWPPLSEAYVQKYLRLENYILQQELKEKKRKDAEPEEGTQDLVQTQIDQTPQENVNTPNINLSIISGKNDSQLEQSMLDSCIANTSSNLEASLSNKTHEYLESSNISGNNDSGLGGSILDETNNTLENAQISCSLETSINDSKLSEDNKSLNATESQVENDDVLGRDCLDQSRNTENTTENIAKLNTTTNKENVNDSNMSDDLDITESRQEDDSSLGTNVLNQVSIIENNAPTEPFGNMEVTQKNICETTAETSGILDTVIEQGGEAESNQCHGGNLTKTTENRKDSGLNDRHNLISTENLAISREDLNKINEESGRNLKIDLVQQQDKSTTQIRIHLPYTDDEGVYFSDLEEHDCRLLSPIIKAPNILPGVQRKDVTIVMDDELRQALEMRDSIMEHFGHEIYKVPVITEPKKQSLIFNILKLPEKQVRRKVLFKLGPDMDLYLKGRSVRHYRPERIANAKCNAQLLQWYSLNNTDMADVCMTPPISPEQCSVFRGFSDSEDDAISCAEFCGFTEEEQSSLMLKHISRLSRDSGVGVDLNNLTPEKETLEMIFEDLDATQSTKSILNRLPVEIRDVLTAELNENSENNSTTATQNKETVTENNSQIEHLCTQTNEPSSETVPFISTNSDEQTEMLSTENSIENSECVATENSTQESNAVLTGNSADTFEEQNAINLDSVPITQSQGELSDVVVVDTEGLKKIIDLKTTDESCNIDQSNESAEELFSTKKIDFANNTYVETNDSDDDTMLNLDTQGSKTKIQQWHEYLQPILAKSRERHHFDVYKLGTEIIDTIQSRSNSRNETSNELKSTSASSDNPVASFHEIMDCKDKSYVSRYFLSALLLANQSNIEISACNKSSEKASSWHDINFKLIGTKRHTVAIEDNIGMIDKKQKAREKNTKQNSKEIGNNVTNIGDCDEEEDDHEPLIKLQSTNKAFKKLKTSLKRISDNGTTSNIAEKKPKEIMSPTSRINSRYKELPNLIQSAQTAPLATTRSAINIPVKPSTSREAQEINTDLINFNIDAIRTLQPIEKVQKRGDDHDSGIFSIDEMSTS